MAVGLSAWTLDDTKIIHWVEPIAQLRHGVLFMAMTI